MKYILTCLAAGAMALASLPAHAKKCDWRITGKFQVEHRLGKMAGKYGDHSPLRNIQVRLGAKEVKWDPAWNTWDTVRTNSNGEFTITKQKDCSRRYFRLEVKFQDAEIELRHENSTSSLTKVKWYEAWNTANFGNKRDPSVVDVGTLTFGPSAGVSGKHERADFQVYRHAELWTVLKMVNDRLESFGQEFDFERTLTVKYPHNSWLVGDAEASYVNPITKIMYLHKDGSKDHFTLSTILHETAHAWAYDKFYGEGCLTWDLVLTHDTHDLAKNSCPAFHEGFADAFQLIMEKELMGDSLIFPLNRAKMKSGVGLTDPIPRPELVERLDLGWRSVFMSMLNERLPEIDYGVASDTPGSAVYGTATGICDKPKVSAKDLLSVFLSNSNAGFFRDLTKEETRIQPFLSRAAAIIPDFDDDHVTAIAEAHDSRLTSQPSEFLCGNRIGSQKNTVKPLGEKLQPITRTTTFQRPNRRTSIKRD